MFRSSVNIQCVIIRQYFHYKYLYALHNYLFVCNTKVIYTVHGKRHKLDRELNPGLIKKNAEATILTTSVSESFIFLSQ